MRGVRGSETTNAHTRVYNINVDKPNTPLRNVQLPQLGTRGGYGMYPVVRDVGTVAQPKKLEAGSNTGQQGRQRIIAQIVDPHLAHPWQRIYQSMTTFEV